MNARQLSDLLHGKRVARERYMARCPAHDDRRPSLSIRDGKRGVMLKCFSSGCTAKQICAALGIPVSALFFDERKPDREAMRRLEEAELRREAREREKRSIRLQALQKAGLWERVSKALGALLVRFPEADDLAALFHFALDRQRRMLAIADSFDFPHLRGNGNPRHRGPIRREEVGDSIFRWLLKLKEKKAA